MHLRDFIDKHSCPGETEINFLARLISSTYGRQTRRPAPVAGVLKMLREHYRVEQRGNIEVVRFSL